MSILLDACHGSLQPQLKPQQRGNSLLIVCKFNSTCRDGVKEEPVKPREVSVYLRGKICVSGRHQQDSYTNSRTGQATAISVTPLGWWLRPLQRGGPCFHQHYFSTPVSGLCYQPAQRQALWVLAWSRSPSIMLLLGNSLPGRELYPRAPHQPGRIQHPVWVSAQFRANLQPCRMEEMDTSE